MVTTNDQVGAVGVAKMSLTDAGQSKERKDATTKLTSLSKKKGPSAAVWPCFTVSIAKG